MNVYQAVGELCIAAGIFFLGYVLGNRNSFWKPVKRISERKEEK